MDSFKQKKKEIMDKVFEDAYDIELDHFTEDFDDETGYVEFLNLLKNHALNNILYCKAESKMEYNIFVKTIWNDLHSEPLSDDD